MSTTARPQAEGARQLDLRVARSRFLGGTAQAALLLSMLIFFGLHFAHLTADFPNNSRWMDWSKYTDEGWYGDAAIRHFLLGHWYVPGDFNPAVALPVWPLLETFLFEFTGVSLIAARTLTVCVFGCILVVSWLVIGRSKGSDGQSQARISLAGSLAVLLLAANPFCYVFTRLAILEPLLILLGLLALLAAQSVRLPHENSFFTLIRVNFQPLLALSLLLPLMVLTKTTGLFLLPAIAWMLFASVGYRVRQFFQAGVPAAALGAVLWLAYFLILVRPRYRLDFHYLFSANAHTSITRSNYVSVLENTFKDGAWFGLPLFVTALGCIAVALLSIRRLRSCPIVPALLLWAAGYLTFLAYHDNLQPRYYLVVAVPLTLLVPVVFRDLVLPRLRRGIPRRTTYVLAAVVLGAILLPDVRETLSIVRHPQYTFVGMAQQVAGFIRRDQEQHPGHSPLLLSISGSDLSLITGLPSICDDFGTSELADRVNLYKPGWYAAWNLIEDDKMDALDSSFRVTRVATFPAMDDNDRNLMVLYRLDPADEPEERANVRKGRNRHRVGQQPSSIQLKH